MTVLRLPLLALYLAVSRNSCTNAVPGHCVFLQVQRTLLGMDGKRRGAVGAAVFAGVLLLLVMSTSMSSIGLLQSYDYASALMEPVVRLLLPPRWLR
jgi:hypothetical protein